MFVLDRPSIGEPVSAAKRGRGPPIALVMQSPDSRVPARLAGTWAATRAIVQASAPEHAMAASRQGLSHCLLGRFRVTAGGEGTDAFHQVVP